MCIHIKIKSLYQIKEYKMNLIKASFKNTILINLKDITGQKGKLRNIKSNIWTLMKKSYFYFSIFDLYGIKDKRYC